jgi:Fe-S-cluster containining protein
MPCLKCGACCRILRFEVPWSRAQVEFLEARGLSYTESGDFLLVDVQHVCPQLVGNQCRLKGDAKPLACRDFPAEGQVPLLGCGFVGEQQ